MGGLRGKSNYGVAPFYFFLLKKKKKEILKEFHTKFEFHARQIGTHNS